MTKKQIIIIGGGNSIKPEINKGLWDKLKGKYTIGLNYSYRFFNSTLQCFVDHLFYTNELEGLKKLPLVIGKYHAILNNVKKNNTIMLPTTSRYNRYIQKGVYKASLVGIFALTLAIYFLKEGEIYLLGYDLGADKKKKDQKGRAVTHFYQDKLQHAGTGKVGYYKIKNKGHLDFSCFKNLEEIKIYNVGLESKLEEFEKINYEHFYQKLNKENLNQDELRESIKNKLSYL